MSTVRNDYNQIFNLENAVECEKDVQDIDVHGEFEKHVVTLLVMSGYSNFSVMRQPEASRTCADFRNPTAFSRFKVIGRAYYEYDLTNRQIRL